MTTWKIILEYDGTDFAGWQIQPEQRTVQGVLESALQRLMQETIRVTAAGRTDAGVHALAQTVSFTGIRDMDPDRMKQGVNAMLPGDVRVVSAVRAPDGFSARHRAVGRWYRYVLTDRERAVARQYAWKPRYRLDLQRMKSAAKDLLGEHDFSAFSKHSDDVDSYVTTVSRIVWEENQGFLFFDIHGIRFFHNMIRIIVGTLVDIGRGYLPEDAIRFMLESRDRTRAGPTAPPHGLFFMGAEYENL